MGYLQHTHTSPTVPTRPRIISFGFFLVLLISLSACRSSLPVLQDDESIPVGSRVEFWVFHDEGGWQKSNIHIAKLQRPMTGAEARRWAEGVGHRDADMRWTHYYVAITYPEPARSRYRTAVYPNRSLPFEVVRR